MTSATEVLRRMLDERGVEYEAPHAGFTIVRTDNAVCKFYETLEEPERGVFAVVTTDWLTPEQAIAATLGRGECHIKPWKMERDTGFYDCMECSECGYVTDVSEWAKATYCAGCGRRIEQ